MPELKIQRVYTDDLSLDETMSVADGDVTLVPRGYHPRAALHGYDLYYLNVMAGPKGASFWINASSKDGTHIIRQTPRAGSGLAAVAANRDDNR